MMLFYEIQTPILCSFSNTTRQDICYFQNKFANDHSRYLNLPDDCSPREMKSAGPSHGHELTRHDALGRLTNHESTDLMDMNIAKRQCGMIELHHEHIFTMLKAPTSQSLLKWSKTSIARNESLSSYATLAGHQRGLGQIMMTLSRRRARDKESRSSHVLSISFLINIIRPTPTPNPRPSHHAHVGSDAVPAGYQQRCRQATFRTAISLFQLSLCRNQRRRRRRRQKTTTIRPRTP